MSNIVCGGISEGKSKQKKQVSSENIRNSITKIEST